MERKPLASHNCVICYMHTECMRCIALSGLDNNKDVKRSAKFRRSVTLSCLKLVLHWRYVPPCFLNQFKCGQTSLYYRRNISISKYNLKVSIILIGNNEVLYNPVRVQLPE